MHQADVKVPIHKKKSWFFIREYKSNKHSLIRHTGIAKQGLATTTKQELTDFVCRLKVIH